jgi:hypothetical protein
VSRSPVVVDVATATVADGGHRRDPTKVLRLRRLPTPSSLPPTPPSARASPARPSHVPRVRTTPRWSHRSHRATEGPEADSHAEAKRTRRWRPSHVVWLVAAPVAVAWFAGCSRIEPSPRAPR